jgi:hypothetical protein
VKLRCCKTFPSLYLTRAGRYTWLIEQQPGGTQATFNVLVCTYKLLETTALSLILLRSDLEVL